MDEIVSFSYIEVFTDHFLYNSPQFITDVLWHTQRLVNFVTIFSGSLSLPCGIGMTQSHQVYGLCIGRQEYPKLLQAGVP